MHSLELALLSVAARCGHLQSVALVNVDVTDRVLLAFVRGCGPQLRRVAIGRCALGLCGRCVCVFQGGPAVGAIGGWGWGQADEVLA